MKVSNSIFFIAIVLAVTIQNLTAIHLTHKDVEELSNSSNKESKARIRRQVITDPQPFTPLGVPTVLQVPIPTNIGFFPGTGQPVDMCARDQIQMEYGTCQDILKQGNCGPNEEVLMDPSTNLGFCAPRLCPPDRIFLPTTQLCHDPTDTSVCPPGRELFYSAYGTAVCSCPDGTIEGDDDLDDNVCEVILGKSMQCPYGQTTEDSEDSDSDEDEIGYWRTENISQDGDSIEDEKSYRTLQNATQVFWFKDFQSPPQCLPDPCSGANLRKGPNELPFVPSKTGQCFQIGQSEGVCPTGQLYALSLEELLGECTTLEDAGYTIINPENLTEVEAIYGPIASKNRQPLINQTGTGPNIGNPFGQGTFGSNIASSYGQGNNAVPPIRQGINGQAIGGQNIPSYGQEAQGQNAIRFPTSTQNNANPNANESTVIRLKPTSHFKETINPENQGPSNQGQTTKTGVNENRFVPSNPNDQLTRTNPVQGTQSHNPMHHVITIGQGMNYEKRPMNVNIGLQTEAAGININNQRTNIPNSKISFVPTNQNGRFQPNIQTSPNIQNNRNPRVLLAHPNSHGQHIQNIQSQGQQKIQFPPQNNIGVNSHARTSFPSSPSIRLRQMRRRPTILRRPLSNPNNDQRMHQHQQQLPFMNHQRHVASRNMNNQNQQQTTPHRRICTLIKSNRGGPAKKSCAMIPIRTSNFGNREHLSTNPFNSIEHFGSPQPNSPEMFEGHSPMISAEMMNRDYGFKLGKSIGFRNPPRTGLLRRHFTELPDGRRITHLRLVSRPRREIRDEEFSNLENSLSDSPSAAALVPHSRKKRAPLPYASPSNVFEPKLLKCRPGAVRDINAKCRDTVLPPRIPRPRNTRAAPPISPTPSCPRGMAFNIRRICVPSAQAQNALSAFRLG